MRKAGWWIAASVAPVVVIGAAVAAGPVPPEAYAPYKRSGYPKTVAIWGEAGMRRIDAYRKKAALLAAQNPRCDEVESSDFSVLSSRPPDDILLYVYCGNGMRLDYSSAGIDIEEARKAKR